MKKGFALITALMVALTMGCAAALAELDDSVPPSTPEMKAYESIWISDDGETRIWIGRQDEGFQIEAVQKTGEDSFNSWGYLAMFDGESKSIRNAIGTKDSCVYRDGREEVQENLGDEFKADFSINENGKLIWKDYQDDAGAGLALTRIGNFAGKYGAERATIDFVWNVHENDYSILVSWGQSAWETWDYQMKGTYDPETETVTAKGLKQLLTYKDDGEIDTTADPQEAEVDGVFSFDENGGLVWKSSTGEADGIVFENDAVPLWAW